MNNVTNFFRKRRLVWGYRFNSEFIDFLYFVILAPNQWRFAAKVKIYIFQRHREFRHADSR
jgi:hypothetical protein